MVNKSDIDLNLIPRHVAIIMDGNGRWAKQQGKERIFGHQAGVESVKDVVEAAAEINIQYLTLYAFSTENWKRPVIEVSALMQLLVNTISNEADTLMKNNVRLMVIGDVESLPEDCRTELKNIISLTSTNDGLTVVLALSYSAKWEIIQAVKKIAAEVKNDHLTISKIDEELFSAYLSTKDIPDPELLIRTSGEYRVSNFLLWQIAYAEFYFTEKLWPEFKKPDFFEAISDFQCRERRFGKTSEQLKQNT